MYAIHLSADPDSYYCEESHHVGAGSDQKQIMLKNTYVPVHTVHIFPSIKRAKVTLKINDFLK